MMNLKNTLGLVGGCAVLGAAAASASGQVYAQAEATVLIEYLEVREITNGTPVGPTGLNWHFWSLAGGTGFIDPWQNLGGVARGIPGPPITGPGLNAPSPNTGYSNGLMFDYTVSPYGFGSRGQFSSTTIHYSNVTNGNSQWEIKGEVSFNLSLASDLTDPTQENVDVTGTVRLLIIDENGITFHESLSLRVSGLNASNSVSSPAFPFTMVIGNIGSGFRRDFAEIRIDIDLVATMHAVPAPGVLVLVSMAGVLAAGRRRN